MAEGQANGKKDAPSAHVGRIGVVDIGSNTVRLVVYDVPTRLPFPLFNEKAQCGLGRTIAKTGRLDPDGVKTALRALARFVLLAEAMDVDRLELVATAAVREADDGPDFVAEIGKRFGCTVDVVDGAEEAQLAAHGLLSGVPDADGLLGDLGGGSLDLVVLDRGQFGRCATYPLGHLRLAESAGEPKKAVPLVAAELDSESWLDEISGRDLFAAGGSLRTVARVFLDQLNWPLHVIDNFSLPADEALQLLGLIARMGRGSIRKIPHISRRRSESLPYAALVLEMLIQKARPRRLVFSGFGMREGRMLSCLPEDIRRQDPLIAGCISHAERGGRFSVHGDEIMTWMAPVFDGESAADARLRLAACLISDIGWSVHPDYRAENAFHRVLRLPFAGLTHTDRAALATTTYVRYGGDPTSPSVAHPMSLLDEAASEHAIAVGLALHLANTLSGGAPGLLTKTRLKRNKNSLTLELPEDGAVYLGEAVERRLGRLARALDLKPKIGSL
jgi:exopolyphosphatase / guanosine-5'-triphosphate,3'-diphosphate pyrophosphatase